MHICHKLFIMLIVSHKEMSFAWGKSYILLTSLACNTG